MSLAARKLTILRRSGTPRVKHDAEQDAERFVALNRVERAGANLRVRGRTHTHTISRNRETGVVSCSCAELDGQGVPAGRTGRCAHIRAARLFLGREYKPSAR